jgi:hypothetical protein
MSLTSYNQNFGLVREVRSVHLRKGTTKVTDKVGVKWC